MAMKPQDIVIALKLLSEGADSISYAALASELGMSASEVHGGMGRLREGRLLLPGSRVVVRQALRDLIVSGIAHVFPAKEGEPARGLATAWAAPVFEGRFTSRAGEGPVWADPNGDTRGPSVEPLYKSVPKAASRDQDLYDYLALVDTIRLGRARERGAAIKKLDQRILSDG